MKDQYLHVMRNVAVLAGVPPYLADLIECAETATEADLMALRVYACGLMDEAKRRVCGVDSFKVTIVPNSELG